MKNVLIINGHQRYENIAEGNLTRAYIDRAESFLTANGFAVQHSVVESDYSIEEEVAKFDWADYIIMQYPVYWMGVPWITKKYIDEIEPIKIKLNSLLLIFIVHLIVHPLSF